MFLWDSYQKFASSTELHGFDQVLKYNKFWAAVWICLTVAACGMCINDVVNLAITYQSEPTVTSLVLQPNWDLSPPNPTLCMEVYIDAHNMRYSEKLNLTYPTQDIESDLQAFLAATKNAENLNIFDRSQLSLSYNLQYFTYLMLSYMAEAELTYVGYNSSVLTSFVTEFSCAADSPNDQMINATVGYLYQRYLNKKVSFANLKRLIGMSICQQRTDILTRTNATHSITSTICKPRMITHLSFSIVCSKLLDDNIEELADYSKITLSGTKLSLVGGPQSNTLFYPQTFSSSQVTFAWHLDFQGRPMLPIGTRQDVFSWNPADGRAFELTVATEYQLYSTRRNPCQAAEWQYDCEFNKRLAMMERKCGCRPSSILYGVQDLSLPTCSENPLKPSWTQTKNPTTNLTYSDFTGICGNQPIDNMANSSCVPDCNVFVFDIAYAQPSLSVIPGPAMIQMVGDSVEFHLPSGVVEFTVNMGKSRQLVIESAAKSFSTFICDFGGSIGAWLGASLLAFVHAAIHMLLTCSDTGKRMVEAKKK